MNTGSRPNYTPPPPEPPEPVTPIWSGRKKDGQRLECELRSHGEFGVEVRVSRDGGRGDETGETIKFELRARLKRQFRMIRAVLFDLDGTLYDRDAVVLRVAHEQFETFRGRLGHVNRDELIARTLALDDHGYARRAAVYRTLLTGMDVDAQLAADLESHFWDCYCRHCRLPEDTVATLEALRAAGHKLAVITNGPVEWQSRKLCALGLADYFHEVLISEAEGVEKPNPVIFGRALERLGVRPNEAVFVGDHPAIDVAGAHAAGLLAVWKRVPYWTMTLDDVIVVDRLSEILAIVKM